MSTKKTSRLPLREAVVRNPVVKLHVKRGLLVLDMKDGTKIYAEPTDVDTRKRVKVPISKKVKDTYEAFGKALDACVDYKLESFRPRGGAAFYLEFANGTGIEAAARTIAVRTNTRPWE